jgi:hypothetical protein
VIVEIAAALEPDAERAEVAGLTLDHGRAGAGVAGLGTPFELEEREDRFVGRAAAVRELESR